MYENMDNDIVQGEVEHHTDNEEGEIKEKSFMLFLVFIILHLHFTPWS